MAESRPDVLCEDDVGLLLTQVAEEEVRRAKGSSLTPLKEQILVGGVPGPTAECCSPRSKRITARPRLSRLALAGGRNVFSTTAAPLAGWR